jgi:hypothetical protein
MNLKLTSQQLNALLHLLTIVVDKHQSKDMWDKLLRIELTTLHLKFAKQALVKKISYRLKISEAEAVAFWLTFSDHNLPTDSFEGNLIDILNNNIHQKVAV